MVVKVLGEGIEVKFWTSGGRGLPKLNKRKHGGRGSIFWAFCSNVIIECSLNNANILTNMFSRIFVGPIHIFYQVIHLVLVDIGIGSNLVHLRLKKLFILSSTSKKRVLTIFFLPSERNYSIILMLDISEFLKITCFLLLKNFKFFC